MSENLVIVESPAKAKTIARYLGKKFTVKASMGHVRDLPKSKMGVDVEGDFEPTYDISPDKKKVIADLKKSMKGIKTLWIATDEDREGEAIGWHLLQALKVDEKKIDVKRIVFHEITKSAIEKAVDSPRDINQDLVDAQQARRVLDRIVGYELSPLLWKKIRYGLSAGRVQSVVVRLIVERERAILAFNPEEYWSIEGEFDNKNKESFQAKLHQIDGKKMDVNNEKDAKAVMTDLEKADYEVTKVEEKDKIRNPSAPFITSTLQQEASRKLHFSVKKTMMVAQQLYEGVDVDGHSTALVTYMRTDSVTLSDQALKQAQEVIADVWGKEYCIDAPRVFKNKKNAQAAHEAIRPVDLSIKPADVESSLSKDQFKVYELVWKRTLASQMQEAKLKTMSVDIQTIDTKKEYIFRASGQRIVFPGFIKAYIEGSDDPDAVLESKDNILPALAVKEMVTAQNIDPLQHFTKPPARYTEASLVKKLEEEGIGRPSTYAPTISTVIARGYVEKEQKQLRPTDTAMVVTDMLVEHFSNIVDYKFTAEMEDDLDKIAEGEKKWIPLLKDFYGPFHAQIVLKDKTLKKEDIVSEETDEKCEKCGKNMQIKLGRYGKFLSCSNYPECKHAKPLAASPEKQKELDEKDAEMNAEFKDIKCDKCSKPMAVKRGRFGPFLGCSDYPDCKSIKPIIQYIGVDCPDCGGKLIERRTKKGGRLFFGCDKYPKCKHASWKDPRKKDGEEDEE